MRIAVFGHDASHAVLARRISGMEALGHDVTAFTMRRDEDKERGWRNIDLGQTHDAQLVQRAFAIRKAIKTCRQDPHLTGVDLFWARNLDMLAIAVAARRDAGSHAPILYETLDIHHALTASGLKGNLFRFVERKLLKKVKLIVVSSPGFVREYYDKVHPDHPPTALIENTLLHQHMPPRPTTAMGAHSPLRLGWVGHLRCARTFSLMQHVAQHFKGRIEIHAHGLVAESAIPNFHETLAKTPHMTWHGPYDAATDLEGIYSQLDIVWAGVTYQEDTNAKWLLASRPYEGGYFGVPALVIAGTETARFLKGHGIGTAIAEPLHENLVTTLEGYLSGSTVKDAQQRVLDVPTRVFARGTEDLDAALQQVMA